MKILLIGSGGREHALAWKMAQSPNCEHIFIAPGNAGTAKVGTNTSIDISNHEAVAKFVSDKGIDMVVVGPEQPLVEGITDFLQAKGIAVVGPSQEAAQLEGSKDFSKRFMQKYGIPTAAYAAFESHQEAEAMAFIEQQKLPIVVKADGLAAGKGVLICETHAHAKEITSEMLSGKAFGEAGTTVVIEEFLKGIEISIFVLTDGEHYHLLPSAKDYKRIGEGDTGLNTGGMGAVSPVPFADEAFVAAVDREIVQPTMRGIREEKLDYKGFIFIGLMIVEGKAYVLEYNVRMGDPETEVIMPRLEADLVDLFAGVVNGNLHEKALAISPKTCTTVMLVSGGYPASYPKGKLMTGFDKAEGSILFHAGTKQTEEGILTNGGRVLAISSLGDSIEEAVGQSLLNAEKISFDGKFYRRDIGQDLLK
ncbi:MAG: phosphoribosylamine--glycine ligase [Bacteroidota bacterium]